MVCCAPASRSCGILRTKQKEKQHNVENKYPYLFLKYNSNIICLKLQMICADFDSLQVASVPAFLLMKNLTPDVLEVLNMVKLVKALKN